MLRAMRTPAIIKRMSFSDRREMNLISGGAKGLLGRRRTVPRPSGARWTGAMEMPGNGWEMIPAAVRSIVLQAEILNWRSGRSRRLSLRTRAPTYRPLPDIRPERKNTYWAPAMRRWGRRYWRAFSDRFLEMR